MPECSFAFGDQLGSVLSDIPAWVSEHQPPMLRAASGFQREPDNYIRFFFFLFLLLLLLLFEIESCYINQTDLELTTLPPHPLPILGRRCVRSITPGL